MFVSHDSQFFATFSNTLFLFKIEIMNGYIKLHRKLIDWEWYSNIKVKTVFIHLLLLANFKDTNWRGQGIKRGQLVTSYPKLSTALGLSVQELRTCFKKLKSTHDINSKPTGKNILVTLVKFDTYQSKESDEQHDSNRESTQQQHDSNTIATGNQQQRKNDKKDKNININKETRIFPDITSQKTYDKNDKRIDKNLPFDLVSSSKTLTAIYGLDSDSLRKELIENWGCDSTHDEIKECLYNFTTQYIENPKYEGSSEIRDIEGLKISFIKWIPLCLKMAKQYPTQFKPKKVKRKHDYDLSKYYQANYLPKHFRKITANGQLKADLEQFSNEFENLLAISAKYPTNETFNPMLVFEVLNKPLGRFLHGSTPKRKEASLLRFMEKQSEYNQARGDVRKLLQKEREKQAL